MGAMPFGSKGRAEDNLMFCSKWVASLPTFILAESRLFVGVRSHLSWPHQRQNSRDVPCLCSCLSNIKTDSCLLLVTMSFPSSSEIEKLCHLDSNCHNATAFAIQAFQNHPAWAHKVFACIGNSLLNKLTPAGFAAELLVSHQMYLKGELLSV